ncbi:MAG: hypothetical protein ACM3ZT_09030 [Bacillota bacterium]
MGLKTRIPGVKGFATTYTNHTGMLFRRGLVEQVSVFFERRKIQTLDVCFWLKQISKRNI